MDPRLTLLLCLLLLGPAAADAGAGRPRDVQSDPPTPEHALCRFSKKELHTTVRSAAGSALTGVCNPAEMESRLLEMEQRLSHRLEELKQTFTRLLIDGVAYDYDEEGDSSDGIEQHPYTGGASATAATDDDDVSGQAEDSGFEAYNRIAAASTAQRTTYSSASETAPAAASSVDADTDSAGSRDSGAQGSSSRRHSYKWSSSSRRSSADSSGAQARAGGATGDAASSEDVDTEGAGSQSPGSHGSSSRRYSYKWSSSSRGSSRDASGDQARGSGATSDAASSQDAAAEADGAQRSGSSSSSSRRYSYERRASSQGASGAASGEQARVGGAIGGAAYSQDAGSQNSGSSRSSSRRYSHKRTSSRGSAGAASGEQDNDGVVDFGPGGGPAQTSWFPGTSRTTIGTGAPDLSGTPERTGGFGFGAVGEPLGRTGSSQTSSGARVRSGDASYTAGGGGVVYRDSQTYGSSAEARRPGSIGGGSTDQYATDSGSGTTSGERQVSAYDASRHSRRGGTEVRFSNSYTPTDRADAYFSFGNQQSRASSARARHSDSNSRRTNRRRGSRRNQRVYDTVSSISGSDSVPRSRYLGIDTYNDTVYEVDGKRRYSYYWEIKDFPTMMATWEHRHSLRSPSFYVYQGGYRMYIRVFPSRQGGNVYLHTGLTPGRYDDQLSWPFPLRLRLSLLDHSNLEYDIRSRIWDPRKLCSGWNWKRPRRKDNFECVGLGFPQSLLETQRFLIEGAVLIKLDVFLED